MPPIDIIRPRRSAFKEIVPRKLGAYWKVVTPRDLRDGPTTKRFFRSKQAALNHCAVLTGKRGELGQKFFRLSQPDQALVLRALELAGDAQSLWDACKFWKEQKPAEVATLKELAIRCVAAKERRSKGGEATKYTKSLKQALKLFIAGGEETLAHQVQPHHIDEWVNSNPHWSQDTKLTYLKHVRTMFSFGLKHKLTTVNPALSVEQPEHADTAPVIFSPGEAERLMRAAEKNDPKLVRYLALAMFGGLRCDVNSEIWRLHPDDINIGSIPPSIAIQGKRMRSRNRRFLELRLYPSLVVWLSAYSSGDLQPVNYRRRLNAVAAAANVKWHQNAMRHSFVSYSCAIHGTKETAQQSGHSEDVLNKRYRELVSRDDAERFWRILPKIHTEE
jgi:integrase